MKDCKFIIAEQLYNKITDGTHDSPNSVVHGFPLVTSKNIKGGILDISTANLISEKDYNNINKRSKVEKWDVIISMIGEYCGYTYIERNDRINYAVKNVGLFKTGSKLEAIWLTYYLQSVYGRYYLQQVKSGSSQPYLSLGALRNLPILNPSVKIKKGIVNVLSALDDKIELNNRLNTELESMAKLLYEYWFVQFDFPYDFRQSKPADETSKTQDIKPYKSSGGKMIWNKDLNREIPEGWGSGTLSDISSLTRGVTYNKDDIQDGNSRGTIPILRATNITRNQIDLNSMVYVSESLADEDQILQPFDILITMSSGSIDHIGKNGFYLYNEEVAFGAFCAKIQAKGDFTFYLYSYTQSDFFFTTIKNECLGTNINNLNGSMVKGFKLVVPDQATLLNFNQIVKSMFDKIRVNTNLNQQLSSLRDWLLPMLMNGQISVMDAEERVSEELGMVAEGERGKYEKK
jgi:type I restriction enzyme S subunit